MTQKDFLIIYHKEDNDGVFSATLIYDYIINSLGYKYRVEDLVFLGADYVMMKEFANDERNSPKNLHNEFKNIILTDISFEPTYMKALFDEFGNNFYWFDHHAPIINESFKYKFDEVPGTRDTNRSAILCVYKNLYDPYDEAYNNKQVPELLRILSAWDSWTYEKEGYNIDYVRNINKGVTIKYDLSISNIKYLIRDLIKLYNDEQPSEMFNIKNIKYKDDAYIEELHNYGQMLNDYDDKIMSNIVKTSGDKTWHIDNKRNACAIFHQGASNSLMFKCLKDTNIEHGIIFKHNPNGMWTVSLYNVNDDCEFHCGEYLKDHYKGGGHKGAAGCQITQDQFIKILKDKNI